MGRVVIKEKNYKDIINRIIDTQQDKLSDWELDFMSSIHERHILNGIDLKIVKI